MPLFHHDNLPDENSGSGEISREFIAVPDDKKQQVVYKWPDRQIRRFAHAIVDADEQALFISQGVVVGTLPPGRHAIDASELPFLGALVDAVSKGRAYDTELFFVATREIVNNKFGGQLGAVTDPQTTLVVQLRAFGEFGFHAVDPAALIKNLTGTVDVSDSDALTDWVAGQLLQALRTWLVTQITTAAWPVLGLSAKLSEIQTATVAAANEALASYGLAVTRLADTEVNMSDEDLSSLKSLAHDVRYTSLAGGFGAYAQGEALLEAGQGMEHGSGAAAPLVVAGLGLGAGVGAQATAAMAAPIPQPAAPASATPTQSSPSPPATRTCPSCAALVPTTDHFCPQCGAVLTPTTCAHCGAVLTPTEHFCPTCGTPVPTSAPAAPTTPAPPNA